MRRFICILLCIFILTSIVATARYNNIHDDPVSFKCVYLSPIKCLNRIAGLANSIWSTPFADLRSSLSSLSATNFENTSLWKNVLNIGDALVNLFVIIVKPLQFVAVASSDFLSSLFVTDSHLYTFYQINQYGYVGSYGNALIADWFSYFDMR